MKKSIFLFLAIIIFSTSSFSQRKSKSKKSEESKTYVSALLNVDSEEIILQQDFFRSSNQSTSIITELLPRTKLSLGFTLQRVNANNTFQEISLTKLNFSESDYETRTILFNGDILVTNGSTNATWDIIARYEYGKYLLSSNNKINIGFSIAASPSFLFSSLVPKVSTQFPVRTYMTNLNLTLVPTISFDITDNFALALKVIPNIFNIEWNRQRIEDPKLSSFFDSGITTNIIARYRIGKQCNTEGKSKKKRRRR